MQQLGTVSSAPALPSSSRLWLGRQRQRQTAARATPKEQQQVELNPYNIQAFVAADPVLRELLGDPEQLRVQELLDGVINTVFAVHGSTGASAVIKQALPYVRAVGESFPLSRERMNVEAAAMQLLHSCCPHHIPQLLRYDHVNSVLAMQYLAPPHQKLLYCIRGGLELLGLAQQLAQLMAAVLAGGCLSLLTPDEAAAATARFANTDIVAANEQVVLAGPFNPDDSSNRWTSPQVDGDVRALWADAAAMAAAADMLQLYRNCKQSLIHNDLHAGNLLAAPGSLFLIDWEFCTTGFDIGCLLGNLLMAALALHGQDDEEQQAAASGTQEQQQQHGRGRGRLSRSRQDTARWLLQVMQEFWQRFVLLFPQHLAAAERAQGTSPDNCSSGSSIQGSRLWSEAVQQQLLLADSCGFAGCCLIRLTIGLHHHPEIQAIADANRRAAVERRCLRLGQQLLKMRAATQAHVRPAAAHGSAGADDSGPDDDQAAVLQSIHQVTALLVEVTEGWL